MWRTAITGNLDEGHAYNYLDNSKKDYNAYKENWSYSSLTFG